MDIRKGTEGELQAFQEIFVREYLSFPRIPCIPMNGVGRCQVCPDFIGLLLVPDFFHESVQHVSFTHLFYLVNCNCSMIPVEL